MMNCGWTVFLGALEGGHPALAFDAFNSFLRILNLFPAGWHTETIP